MDKKLEEIQKLAYAIYQQRIESGKDGNSASDWSMAERIWEQNIALTQKTAENKQEERKERSLEQAV